MGRREECNSNEVREKRTGLYACKSKAGSLTPKKRKKNRHRHLPHHHTAPDPSINLF